MKHLKRYLQFLAVIALVALPACATTTTETGQTAVVISPPAPLSPTAEVKSAVALKAQKAGLNVSGLGLVKFAHADLQTAAAYATANGYPDRGAVYTAIDTQLTACENAISAVVPPAPPSGTVGVFTAYEVAAEAIGQGLPAAVRIHCGVIVLP